MIFVSSLLQFIDTVTQEEGFVSRINTGIISWQQDKQQQDITRWENSLTSVVGTNVVLSGKNKQKRKKILAYQQDNTGCNTTILLTLIKQEKRKRKQQWCNWVGEVYSINQLDQSYRLSLY